MHAGLNAIKKLEMRLRALSPRWVRQVHRAIRAMRPLELSQALPDELVRDCRFCASRVDMLDRLPRGGLVAELGTQQGTFARAILQRNAPQELHVVDIDFTAFDQTLLTDARLRRHQGLTHEVMATFADDHFDWVYVDAGHTYADVLRDARAAASKVKPGGYLVFNDFAHIDPYLGRYGVHRAVTDFALERRWSFHLFAFSPAAVYDVALRKPA